MWSVFSLRHWMRHRANPDETGGGVAPDDAPDPERPAEDHVDAVSAPHDEGTDAHQPLLERENAQSIRKLYSALRRSNTSGVSTDDEVEGMEGSAILSEQDPPTANNNSRWTRMMPGLGQSLAFANNSRWSIPHQKSLSAVVPNFIHSTRAFKLCIFYFFIYLCIAVIAFSVIFEKWSVIDSLYFACVTFTTVGYGDITPQTSGGQIFTCFFALYGICILGIALGIIGQRVVEAQENASKTLKEKSERRLMTMFHREPESEMNSVEVDADHIDVEGERGNNVGEEGGIDHLNVEGERGNIGGETDTDHLHEKGIEDDSRTVFQDAFDLVKKLAPMLLIIILLALFIGWFEEWQWVPSVYYCIVTTTTIGFGDVSPSSQPMRLFAVFFIPTSVAVIGHIVGQVASLYMEREQRKAERKFLRRELTSSDLIAMDVDGDGDVSEAEFISFMLVAMQKVDQESVSEIRNLFRKLDADGSGSLQKADLEIMARRKQKHRKRIVRKFQAAAKLALRGSREGQSDRSNVTFA